MKIAIVHKKGSFSDRWIAYCKNNNIPYKLVNPYKSDILEQLEDCTAFMWHHYHGDYKDVLFAKQLLYSLEQRGLKVFPNFNTTWHFDDKVGQKYLLESIDAPLVPSYVFYTKQDAFKWIKQTTFPKVFKLRGGAGARNVMLAHNKREAIKLVKKSFGRGFSQFNRIEYLKEMIRTFKEGKDSFRGVLKGIERLFILPEFARMHSREKGYVYFQDFIPQNNFDIRVIVIGDKAFAFKRMCRKNDFRASGSGNFVYDKFQIDERCVEIAFAINRKLKSQSIAYDFVFDKGIPLIVEISYGFIAQVYDLCEGYWDINMTWHPGSHFDFCGWMIQEVL